MFALGLFLHISFWKITSRHFFWEIIVSLLCFYESWWSGSQACSQHFSFFLWKLLETPTQNSSVCGTQGHIWFICQTLINWFGICCHYWIKQDEGCNVFRNTREPPCVFICFALLRKLWSSSKKLWCYPSPLSKYTSHSITVWSSPLILSPKAFLLENPPQPAPPRSWW